MRYAVSLPPFTDPATVLGWARAAEGAGWDGFFLWDHVQWRPGVAPLDPWVMLGAVAAVTERMRLGTLVTPLSRRRPYAVAKQVATLDRLSGGRAVLGVGLGEPPDRDFADLGEEADPRVRATMLDEALQVIDQLLRGPTDHTGEHYRVKADLHPRPVQRPRPPIWVAGVTPHRRPLARARRWDGVVPIGGQEDLSPQDLATYLALDGRPTREGWDVVVHPAAGFSAQEYAEAGATWLVRSVMPAGSDNWEAEAEVMVRQSPGAASCPSSTGSVNADDTDGGGEKGEHSR
ncbi:LLM class flavin-dependent oxidoreductase [Ornithinimicrobium sufpigmenti]|uniref:LLM class flavin-dependent oxidoreductase n=1 Tax=Ornithinimicrobium sufpigmenti TaxID=2508882 RepID=UPI0015E1B9C1|nr:MULTISPECIES: LLM class flavin-dependent oxidoreductase [unclassified Ornithinimicrobium]